MITNKSIVQKINKAQNIAIFAHLDPDPDACGSMFAMRNLCQKLGKNAYVFCKGYDAYIAEMFPTEDFKKDFLANEFDLVVVLDFHVEDRLEKCFVEEFRKCQNVIIIDHHILEETEVVPSKNFRIVYKASSSQLVLDLYRELSLVPEKDSATFMYAGLMGDTDRFLHSNLSGEVFEDAKYLFECGADAQYVYDKMFRSVSKKDIMLSSFLYSHLTYLYDGKAAYIIFTKKLMKKLGIGIEDVKMFSNSIINIKGVEVTFLVYEMDEEIFSFSIRSVPKIDLIPLVRKMGGGGHKNAAGFKINYKASKVPKLIKSLTCEVLNG